MSLPRMRRHQRHKPVPFLISKVMTIQQITHSRRSIPAPDARSTRHALVASDGNSGAATDTRLDIDAALRMLPPQRAALVVVDMLGFRRLRGPTPRHLPWHSENPLRPRPPPPPRATPAAGA